MKKVLLWCFLLLFSTTFYAQETKVGRAADKVALKTKKAAKDVKEGTVKTANKVADKSKKVAKDVKQGTVKTANTVADKTKSAARDVKAKVRESNDKAPGTPDKVTGMYNGKKVYTGPRGGKYYINSNGNKTYLTSDK
jgi:colicin import membrane protein